MFSKPSSSKTMLRFCFAGLLSASLTTTLWAQNKTPVESATTNTAATTKDLQGPLDKTIADSQKVWLTVNGQAELAFYLNETTGKAHGGVLLVPDLNQHPASYGLINNLRHVLADNHWHTLAVNMTGADTQRAMDIMTAAIAYLNGQGIFNIALLGEGAGAAQALHYAALLPANDPANSKIRALLLINANNHLPSSDNNNENNKNNESDTLTTLRKIKLPILDAYSNSDFQQQQRAEERKRAAQQAIKGSYLQTRLPQVSDFQRHGENRITQRIRGWLDQNVTAATAGKQ